jgi:hypothetical protein
VLFAAFDRARIGFKGCLMLKRNGKDNRYPLHSNFILRTEANQNVHGTDIEQRKELKDKTRINKEPNFTTELLNNACNWTLLLCIEQHGGDLLNITNENSRYKGGIVEVVRNETKYYNQL